ncbi:MAG: hypothetical protein V4615_12055 [Bacteroidota bacterium]
MKILELEVFATGVKTGYYKNNPPFSAPPITENQLKTLIDNYSQTYGKFKNGGKLLKPVFNKAKDSLLDALDEIAANVNEVAQGDEITVMKAGYKPTKTTRSGAVVPPQPQIETLERGTTGELLTACKVLGSDVSYGCLLSEGTALTNLNMVNGRLVIQQGSPTIYIDENKQRKKIFRGLKPAVVYYAYFFARNNAGVSLLSVPQQIMCA